MAWSADKVKVSTSTEGGKTIFELKAVEGNEPPGYFAFVDKNTAMLSSDKKNLKEAFERAAGTKKASPNKELVEKLSKTGTKLGEGGMGYVFKARDTRLERDVVIKIPRENLISDPEFSARFKREIGSLVNLSHPRIVKIFDVGEHEVGEREKLPYCVMEFVSGGTLRDRQKTGPDGNRMPLSPQELTRWLEPVAEALDFIHKQKYIHRDVKPDNILFDANNNAYLSDFGVAKVIGEQQQNDQEFHTGTGMVLGTPRYMAPELLLGQPFDGKVDQYALAVTVYEVLSGRYPYDAMTPAALFVQLTSSPPKLLDSVVPGMPRGISMAVQKALATKPGDRFPDCVSFAKAVLAGLTTTPLGTAPYNNPLMPMRPPTGTGMRPPTGPMMASSETATHPRTEQARIDTPQTTPTGMQPGASGRTAARPATQTWSATTGRGLAARRPPKNKGLIWGGAGVGVLALSAVVAYVLLKGPSDDLKSTGSNGSTSSKAEEKTAADSGTKPAAKAKVLGLVKAAESGKLPQSADAVSAFVFSPEGKFVGACFPEGKVRLWDTSAKSVHTLSTRLPVNLTALAVSPDGQMVAAGGAGGRVVVWRGTELLPLTSDSKLRLNIVDLAFGIDGHTLLAADAENYCLLDLDRREWKTPHKAQSTESITKVALSKNNLALILLSFGNFQVLDPNSNTKAMTAPDDSIRTQLVKTFAYDPTSDRVVIGYDWLCVWNLATQKEEAKQLGKNSISKLEIESLDFSPDGKRFLYGSSTGRIRLWDVQEQKELGQLAGLESKGYTFVSFTPDGNAFAVSQDGEWRLWKVQ